MTNISQKIKAELAMICAVKPDQIKEDALLIQYGLDSVRSMELIIALEEQFGIEIPDSELSTIKMVRDVMHLVEQKLTVN